MEKLTKSENGQWTLDKSEPLEKPPVSEAQRKAMWAAASSKSKIGIPAKVGKDFAEKDPGGKLPEKVSKDELEKDGMSALAGGFKTAFGGGATPPPPPPPPPPAPTSGVGGAMGALAGGFRSAFGKEELSLSENGQWEIKELDKSSYGPKDMNLYNPKDNVGRKAKRTGEVMEDIGPNAAVKPYTSAAGGTANQQASAEAKRDAKRNAKQPVKIFTEEEKKAFQAKLEAEKKV